MERIREELPRFDHKRLLTVSAMARDTVSTMRRYKSGGATHAIGGLGSIASRLGLMGSGWITL
jgi:hypothetical protein